MEPTYYTGDLVLTRQAGGLRAGRHRRLPRAKGEQRGWHRHHRIVGGNAADGFEMQGDNKDATTTGTHSSDIVGKAWITLPEKGAGWHGRARRAPRPRSSAAWRR